VRNYTGCHQRSGEQSFLHLLLHTLSKSETQYCEWCSDTSAPNRNRYQGD
jgi:hypothetical protein